MHGVHCDHYVNSVTTYVFTWPAGVPLSLAQQMTDPVAELLKTTKAFEAAEGSTPL
jgi:hypothetical protein